MPTRHICVGIGIAKVEWIAFCFATYIYLYFTCVLPMVILFAWKNRVYQVINLTYSIFLNALFTVQIAFSLNAMSKQIRSIPFDFSETSSSIFLDKHNSFKHFFNRFGSLNIAYFLSSFFFRKKMQKKLGTFILAFILFKLFNYVVSKLRSIHLQFHITKSI